MLPFLLLMLASVSAAESDTVALHVVVSANQHLPLLPHFLEHWTTNLGVSRDLIFVDVHSRRTKALDAAHRVLRSYGVTNTWNWTDHFTSTEKRRRFDEVLDVCLLYTSPSPRDGLLSRMPSSA